MRIFAAFAMVEQIRLDVLEDWEQPAALLVGDALPIWTGNTADQRSCHDNQWLQCRPLKKDTRTAR